MRTAQIKRKGVAAMVEALTCKKCKYFQKKEDGVRAWDGCTVNLGKTFIVWGNRAACANFKGGNQDDRKGI